MDALDELIARLRFSHLRMLVALAEERSVHRAALRLHLSQPAISKTLKEVERAFGSTLFERSARGLALTPQGAVVVRGAAVLLGELEHLRAEADSNKRAPVTWVQLGAPPIAALTLAPRVVARLRLQRPDVHVHLREDRVPTLFAALAQGEVDALLTPYNAALMSTPEATSLRFERLQDEAFVLIAAADHALARRRRVSLPALAQEHWILPGPEAYVRQMVDGAFVRAGLRPPLPAIVSNSVMSNIVLVSQGAGLAIVPRTLVQAAEALGTVKSIALHPPLPTVPLALIYRQAAAQHPRIAWLREAAHAEASIALE